jgi:2-hydroxychromene-2-carboxylate isomerase
MVNHMKNTVEFFFDFGSPTSYLAYTQLPKIAADASATLSWRPMLLGGVFKATGNASPVTVPAKGKWMLSDMKLWARRYSVPLKFNPHFPINTLTLMRGAVGFQMRQPQEFERYVGVVYRALWEAQLNLGDPAVLAATLTEAGFDVEAFTAMVGDGGRRRGESQARQQHRRSRVTRRVWCAHLLCRRADVFRPRPAGVCARGLGLTAFDSSRRAKRHFDMRWR